MNTAAARLNVSVIGLGLMGSALAESLLNAGHAVTVWNRTPAKAEPVIANGAHLAASASEAISASDITIVCVTNHAATMNLLRALPGESGGGRVLVELTTMTPDESRELAGWAQARGFGYLEGTIIGVPACVRAGTATIILSGPRSIFAESEPLLRALGEARHLSEAVGAAVSFDRIYYAFVYGLLHAFMEGAALAHAKGFALDVYTATVMARMPIIAEGFIEMGEAIAARNHEVKHARIDIWSAAFAGTLALCRETGVDDALPAAVMHNFDRAIAAGHGDRELTAVFETLIPTRVDSA